MSYDIAFLGGFFPKEFENYIFINSKGNIQNAANELQKKIIEGLDLNNGKPVKIFNSLYIGSFPLRFKKFKIPSFEFQHSNIAMNKDINIGFCNLFGIKHFSRYNTVKKQIIKWCKQDTEEKKILIAYAMTTPFMKVLKFAKKKNNSIITILIVPDLPQYMNTSNKKNRIYKFLKKIDNFEIKRCMPYIDKYVLLTKHMANYLKIKKEDYTIIEGIGNSLDKKFNKIKNTNNRIILYSGTLNKRYGVLTLLYALKYLKDDNIRLYICGEGDAKKIVLNSAKEDKRIVFLGQIPHEKVIQLQKEADLLINPRNNDEEFVKYSFPSKILEYISSGTPTLVYKLDGIPDEYDQVLNYIEGSSPFDLANSIKKYLYITDEERITIWKKSVDFINSKKTPYKQVKKIFELINN